MSCFAPLPCSLFMVVLGVLDHHVTKPVPWAYPKAISRNSYMEISDQACGAMWGLCSFPGWVDVCARAWILEKSTLSCFFSLAVHALYGFSTGFPSVCICRPLTHGIQEGTNCLPHLQLHHCWNLGYPFILRFFPALVTACTWQNELLKRETANSSQDTMSL